jgi:hypothetical protein
VRAALPDLQRAVIGVRVALTAVARTDSDQGPDPSHQIRSLPAQKNDSQAPPLQPGAPAPENVLMSHPFLYLGRKCTKTV